jgi:SAM-dependent methyltransferase
MEQREAIRLIDKGIPGKGVQHWADLGCGEGTFTRALAALLPWGSYIHAVDKERQFLPALINEVSIGFNQLDFVKEDLTLDGLGGILMANSLHYVRDKAGLLKRLEPCFRKDFRFVVVEYESRWPSPWVPYPVSYAALAKLGDQLGYQVSKLTEAPSRFGGMMYSAVLT